MYQPIISLASFPYLQSYSFLFSANQTPLIPFYLIFSFSLCVLQPNPSQNSLWSPLLNHISSLISGDGCDIAAHSVTWLWNSSIHSTSDISFKWLTTKIGLGSSLWTSNSAYFLLESRRMSCSAFDAGVSLDFSEACLKSCCILEDNHRLLE